jgi:hypothetical protein
MMRPLWTPASSSFSLLSSKTGLGIGTLVPVDTLSVGWPVAVLFSHHLAALNFKTGRGSPAFLRVSSRRVPRLSVPGCQSFLGLPRLHPAGRGSPRCGQMGQLPRAPNMGVLATRRRRWEGGICWFVRFSPLSLSPFKKVGSRFGAAGVFGLVAQGPLGL